MAFNPPVSGWTAASIVPNPDLFASAHNNISRVSSGIAAPAAMTSPVTSPAPIAPAYNQLQQSIFPNLQQQQLQATQAASQATGAPASAFLAVEKQLQTDPWSKPSTTTLPQSNFLSPTTGTKAPQSGWVPNNLPQI